MKIISVLLNPTVDEIYEIENFHIGGTFKVKSKTIFPVGKAISFSLGIQELNPNSDFLKVIALIGKEEIPLYSNFLNSKNIAFEFVKVDGKTRSNKTINDPINITTTHVREKGFNVNKKELDNLIQCLKKNLEKGDICVFSGSIPPNSNANMYFKLIKYCKEKGVSCVLDTSGNALLEGIKAKPKIIKPNLVEISLILGEPELNKLDFNDISGACIILFDEAKQLLNDELKIILVTLGEKGALCLTKDLEIHGNCKIDKAVDTVGSGDSFLAGFISSYFLKKDVKMCFKTAIACGAANTLIPGPGMFTKKAVEEIIEKVKILEFD